MRGPADSRPDIHRRLALYHLRKWLRPGSRIPIPTMTTQTTRRTGYLAAAILGAVIGVALVVGGSVDVVTWVDVSVEWGGGR